MLMRERVWLQPRLHEAIAVDENTLAGTLVDQQLATVGHHVLHASVLNLHNRHRGTSGMLAWQSPSNWHLHQLPDCPGHNGMHQSCAGRCCP